MRQTSNIVLGLSSIAHRLSSIVSDPATAPSVAAHHQRQVDPLVEERAHLGDESIAVSAILGEARPADYRQSGLGGFSVARDVGVAGAIHRYALAGVIVRPANLAAVGQHHWVDHQRLRGVVRA